MVQRWNLFDPNTDESWTFPMNPNKMTSVHSPRNLTIYPRAALYNPAVEARGGMARVFEHAKEPYTWTFSGVIREGEEYDGLLYWTRKLRKIHLTDHFGRTFLIRIQAFKPDEKRPTFHRPDRYDYDVEAIIYGVVQ